MSRHISWSSEHRLGLSAGSVAAGPSSSETSTRRPYTAQRAAPISTWLRDERVPGRPMTSSARLRIGVIGAGVMGAQHARVISESTRTELVGIVDEDTERAGLVASRFGVSAVGIAD